MRGKRTKVLQSFAIAAIAVLAWPGLASAQSFPRPQKIPAHKGATSLPALASPAALSTHSDVSSSSPWQLLTNQPPVLDSVDCGPGNPLLLTDGTVMVADNGCQDWWKLTPDFTGSYVNGTWTQLASLPAGYSPLYHASAVLPDGRVIIEGGEYNFLNAVWTNLGAIYNPVTDTWKSVDPPAGWTTIGDASSVILFDGTFMLANCCTAQQALFDPRTLTWRPTGKNKFDSNNEEGWTLLPSKQVLTVDAYVPIGIPYEPTGTNSEIYDPGRGKWHSAGSTVVQLWDSAVNCGGESVATFEVGPMVLRPDGTVFATGSDTCGPGNPGHNAIYNSHTGTWTAGPDFPDALNIADGPASLEPNGKVLMMASPGYGDIPSTFLEWDGRKLTEIPPAPNAANDGSFYGNMLVLPTGQILFTDFSFVSVFTPSGTYHPDWRPTIQFAPWTVCPGGSYGISGFLFNGMSQGAAYGDDAQAATNYPLVRITNRRTGHVFYSRTHDHSSMGVAFRGLVSTQFDVPAGQEAGISDLVVIANGIPSKPVTVDVRR
jgi:hypothetical protein